MGSVLDVIFVTLSQNFQRATMKPVMGGDGVEVWVTGWLSRECVVVSVPVVRKEVGDGE